MNDDDKLKQKIYEDLYDVDKKLNAYSDQSKKTQLGVSYSEVEQDFLLFLMDYEEQHGEDDDYHLVMQHYAEFDATANENNQFDK